MSVWLGKGSIRINRISYVYGDTIPEHLLDDAQRKKLKDKNLIGDMPRLVKPETSDILKKQVETLTAENSKLLSANNGASIQLAKLKDQKDALEKENEKLKSKSKKWSKK
jgi:FtsZ-binding cell division protein ZapB